MPLLRTLKQKFGLATRPVAVRTHLPWYWRWAGIIGVGAIVASGGWAMYDFGMTFAGYRQGESERVLAKLNDTISRQQQEIAALRAQAAQAERQLQIERATHGDLAKQVKTLAEENAAIKEDLAFFQSLMPASGDEGAVTINRFKLLKEALPGEYRYRLLLARTGQRTKEFQGHLQFVLNVVQNDKPAVLMLPPETAKPAKEYQLNFRLFQRIEGTFKVAPDAVVKSLQVRIFENGVNAPKLTQTVNAS